MRVSVNPYKLTHQLRNAADGVAAEPGGIGPTQAELDALANDLETGLTDVRQKMLILAKARAKVSMDAKKGRELMRRVDHLSTAIYGRGSGQKNKFGLRPEDLTRNIYPVPNAPANLRLLDDLNGVLAKWKGTRRANYEIQVCRDPEMGNPAATLFSTRQSILISGLSPGTEIYVRVRARLSGRWSEWSDVVRRYVNA